MSRRSSAVNHKGSHWRTGWREIRPGVRAGLTSQWHSRRCGKCGEVRYIWTQVRISVASRDKANPKKWVVRSYSIKRRDLYDPSMGIAESVPISGKRPIVRCVCLGLNGFPRPMVIKAEAQRWFPPRDFPVETI